MDALRERLGDAWRDEWVAQGLIGVPRSFLAAALSDDPEAVLRQIIEQLREEDPASYRQLEEASRQIAKVAPLVQMLNEFITANTWNESQRIVEQHPELLSDEADELLSHWLEAARSQGDASAVRVLEEQRALLRRCREVGVAQAFVEHAEAIGTTALPSDLLPMLTELTRPDAPLDMPQRIDLCHRALALIDRASQPQLWAAVTVILADSLAQHPFGDRAENVERAIRYYEQALEVRTRARLPVEWARTMHDLATAYASAHLRGAGGERGAGD
ncbi:hypothetical protein [Chloroflexus sp.]|uniref:hypothetical protein n=1 Tax=Chloroflexus sp. TaxID=1904827 RepID=UPI002583566F|nr:hypothetical protein [Chloroflexus sp.]